MADRPNKRARRQISEDSTDSSEGERSRSHWSSERQRKAKSSGRAGVAASSADLMSRPRRAAATSAAANANQSSSVTVSRSPSDSPEDRRRSIKLTVKMPSSKLREVTSQSSVGQKNAVNSLDIFEADKTMTGRRSTRVQDTAKLKVYNQDEGPDPWDESDDEDEDDDDDDDGEEEEEEEEDDETDLGGPDPFAAFSTPEDESIPEDDDGEFEEPRPLPANQAQSYPATRPASQQTTKTQGKPAAKPALVVTPAAGGPFKSVEEKEMEMENEEDDELSELDSNVEEEDQDVTNLDVEGDEDELGVEDDAEGDEDVDGEGGDGEGEIDSGDETPGSGTGTPKQQTKRQRGQDDGAFLALPMEPQIKKILTADEHRMRRAEMARRRKNLSEKKNEEEKMSTINRLLKRQVPKRRGKAMNPETLEAATAAEGASPAEVEEIEVERANPFFVRWVNNKDGSSIGVPEEWLGKKVGRLFGPHHRAVPSS